MYSEYKIVGAADYVYVDGDGKQSVKLNAQGFFRALLCLPSARALDLLRFAVGVYAIDRIAKRRRTNANRDGVRQLHVTYAAKDFAFWNQQGIKDRVSDLLSFLTGDDWLFDFVNAEPLLGDPGHQDFLQLPRPFAPSRLALYSGGLDSAAGLVNRLNAGANRLLLVTVSHQSGLHRRVRKQLTAISKLIPEIAGASIDILHSTLGLSLHGGKAKRMRDQEQTQRSRTFLFGSAAAVAADAYGLQSIEVFENGVGSLNFPLMTGALDDGMSTRGAHPTFLKLMSEFVGRVTEKPIEFVLPFKWRTKGELVAAAARTPELKEWLQESRSCIHTSLRHRGKTHCGQCPACIERRQAFAIARMQENLNVYQKDVMSDCLLDDDHQTYLGLYRLEAGHWLERSERTHRRMQNHLRLTNVATDDDAAVYDLHSRHSKEVLSAFHDSGAAGGHSATLTRTGKSGR